MSFNCFKISSLLHSEVIVQLTKCRNC